ncbi:Uncharacterized protein DAT39_023692 [Clarias magur]|uniref:Uncharacterized protein n=1 Tax=Clarias magur TaxID=1594786 RepID=A0A8J4TKM3_CLAMG|nr:Uncharacterized protein DAT39_023692 [Clarias magur]
MTSEPTGEFSRSVTEYTDWSKMGGLSLESSTVTTSSAVPVRWGCPPSTAVSTAE